MGGATFFDVNYLEYSSITGTNLQTASAAYAVDNRSDLGFMTFSDQSGTVVFDFGSSTSFILTDIFVNNHNFDSHNIAIYTGTTWSTIASYSNYTLAATHYSFSSQTVFNVQIKFLSTQDGNPGQVGEIIATRKRFELENNPSSLEPLLIPNGNENNLDNGLAIWTERTDRANVFQCNLGWDLVEGSTVMVGTDYHNISELVRQRTSFLFWYNGSTTTYPNIRPFRPQDLYKCKIFQAVNYTPLPQLISYGNRHKYVLKEVK